MTTKAKLLAKQSLEGLSVGDALGERYFGPTEEMRAKIHARQLPQGNWCFTDDTIMARALLRTLEEHDHVNQDFFVKEMAREYTAEPNRGYGGTVRGILSKVQEGGDWRQLAPLEWDPWVTARPCESALLELGFIKTSTSSLKKPRNPPKSLTPI
ncbi:MAG: ADP-ribosylglycohydrolase family protein [Planctomycetota bacterium]|nr:ADP-ribosylglycohydrolase family protein [Planctomycetota bacterium]